ncbi:MAG TPA: hypothetical protein QF555_04590 [Candidatus Thalassarchaeaceae archaeon]|nr:hypothetical protein [Candidatus Thalassarchaeaceae archaeon]
MNPAGSPFLPTPSLPLHDGFLAVGWRLWWMASWTPLPSSFYSPRLILQSEGGFAGL